MRAARKAAMEGGGMAWWSWCILGVVLFGMELLAVDAQFYLVFAGIAAIVVGLLGLVGIDLPVWAQWLSFAALSIVAMFTIRQQLYAKLMNKPLGKISTDIHQRVVLRYCFFERTQAVSQWF